MRNRIATWIADHLPRKVVYFATIRAWAHATTEEYSSTTATEVTAVEVLDRWEEP